MKKFLKKALVSAFTASALLSAVCMCSGWTKRERACSDDNDQLAKAEHITKRDVSNHVDLDEMASIEALRAATAIGGTVDPQVIVRPPTYRSETKYETVYGRVSVTEKAAYSGTGELTFTVRSGEECTITSSSDFSANVGVDWASLGASYSISQSKTVTRENSISFSVPYGSPSGIYIVEAFVSGVQCVKYRYAYKDTACTQLIEVEETIIGEYAPHDQPDVTYALVGYRQGTTSVVFSGYSDIGNTVLRYDPYYHS